MNHLITSRGWLRVTHEEFLVFVHLWKIFAAENEWMRWRCRRALEQGTVGGVLGWDHGLWPSPPNALPRALVSLQLRKTDCQRCGQKTALKTSGWGRETSPLPGDAQSLKGWMAPNSSPVKSSGRALAVCTVCVFCCLNVDSVCCCWSRGGNCWGGLCWWPGPGRAQTGNVRYNSHGCAEVTHQPAYFSAGVCGFVRNSCRAARQHSGRGHSKK